MLTGARKKHVRTGAIRDRDRALTASGRHAVSWVVSVLLAVATWTFPAQAETRIALVIGNGDYTSVPPLANPVNDAQLIAESLREVGFEVIERINVNQIEMKRAIRDFGELLDKAGEDGVGLFYYAGHGVQVRGRNYLIPLGTRIERESDVQIEAVEADTVLQTMDFARTKLNFVVLDACRNNPFARGFRSAGRGLARMDAPRGTLIAYATAPGDTAADGEDGNSPYTRALASSITEPGLSVERMFREVRNEVMEKTKDRQVPWEASSLTGADFFFMPAVEPPGDVATQHGEPDQPGTPPAGTAPDIMVWSGIQNSENPVDYKTFISQFPNSAFVPFAKGRLETIERHQKVAMVLRAPVSADDKLGIYPAGLTPGQSFRHCPTCPEMVPLPTGRFTMGSALEEEGRAPAEGPRFEVTLTEPFAIGKHEITRGEFGEFVLDTGYNYGVGCNVYDGRKRKYDEDANWRSPGYPQTNRHPAVCISWEDANAYTIWLSRKTGENYRLPTEAEWEYAARAGSKTSRFWGDEPEKACAFANVYDKTSEEKHQYTYAAHPCEDGYAETAPVGSFKANDFGLFDMIGNAREWTQDCWHENYQGAPANGLAWNTGPCEERVRRGGTWQHPVSYARSAYRGKTGPTTRVFLIGFRVVWVPLR